MPTHQPAINKNIKTHVNFKKIEISKLKRTWSRLKTQKKKYPYVEGSEQDIIRFIFVMIIQKN